MILVNNEQTIEDFLQACNFLAPNGMKLEYFIVPAQENGNTAQYAPPQQAGFQLEGVQKDLSKVYTQKDPVSKHSFAPIPNDSGTIPNSLPVNDGGPVNPTTQAAIQGTMIKGPAKGLQIIENTSKTKSVMLKESWKGFPKNTLFHFGR